MLFPTIDFAIFFVIVFTGSWMLRPYARAWRWFILAASCVFYLDPFNPVASQGERAVTVNLVIIGATALVGAATSALLRAGFGRYGHLTAAEHVRFAHAEDDAVEGTDAVVAAAERELAARRRSASGDGDRGDRGDDDAEGDLLVRTGDEAPIPIPAASIWVPIATVLMVLAGDVVLTNLFPDRADQSSRFLFLLLGVAFINQAFAKAVFVALGPTRGRTQASRVLVWITIAIDLAMLGFFKYHEFFHLDDLLKGLGINLDIILPIAISFFTFQAISYVVDVGRGEIRPISLLDFTVYLTFFAHVVAGPIVRVKEFAPQLDARPDPRFVQSSEAFELIFRGLFKKVVISSYLSAQIVDPVFAAPATFGKAEVLCAILGYAVQIYADFSGYTDIAIGVALLLGIRFPQNFNAPYTSLSLQEFWRRWHMTLSRWLRDYLYIPLGGNRKHTIFGMEAGEGRTYLNLFLTMVIGGLWHGANWTFIVWGVIHGGGLAIERFVKEKWAVRGALGLPKPVVGVLQWTVTFVTVCAAWVFFRAPDFATAGAIFTQLFTGEAAVGAISRVTPVLVGVIVLSIASQFVPEAAVQKVSVAFGRVPPIFQVLVGAAALVLLQVLGPEGVAPFIYFQF